MTEDDAFKIVSRWWLEGDSSAYDDVKPALQTLFPFVVELTFTDACETVHGDSLMVYRGGKDFSLNTEARWEHWCGETFFKSETDTVLAMLAI